MCWIWEGLEEAHLLNDKTCYLADYGYKSPSEGFEYKVNGSNRIKTKREEKREDCLLRTSIRWHMLLLWDREWSFGHDPWSEPDPCSRSAERWPGRRRGTGGEEEAAARVVGGCGTEGCALCADLGFVATATPAAFSMLKMQSTAGDCCMLIFRSLSPHSPTPSKYPTIMCLRCYRLLTSSHVCEAVSL